MDPESTSIEKDGTAIRMDASSNMDSSMEKVYEAFGPITALDARSTLTLVTSLALIGLSLASRKPNTINFLGINFEPGHWLVLAVPLGLAVIYAATQLAFAWYIETHRFRSAVNGPVRLMRVEWERIIKRWKQRKKHLEDEAEEMRVKREANWNWYEPKILRIIEREGRLFDSRSPSDYEANLEKLAKEREAIEEEFEERKKQSGVTTFDEKVDRYVHGRFVDGVAHPDEVFADKALCHIRRVSFMQLGQITLGFYAPLCMAILSLLLLLVAVAAPDLLPKT